MKISLSLLVFFLILSFVSCGEDTPDPNAPVPDPSGTKTVKLISNGGRSNTFTPEGCQGYLYLSESDNFTGFDDTKEGDKASWYFHNSGTLQSLGNLRSIPAFDQQWTSNISVAAGKGIVAANVLPTKVTYVRLYGDSYLEGIDRGIVLKHQSPFNGNAKEIAFVSGNKVALDTNGNSQEMKFSTSVSYSISTTSSWLTPRAQLGYIDVSAEPNTDQNPRTGYITVSSPGINGVKFEVAQAGRSAFLQLNSAKEYSLSGEKESQETICISSNTDWTIKSDSTWCVLSASSGSMDGEVTLTVLPNSSGHSRKALITLQSRDGVSQSEIVVNQTIGKLLGEGWDYDPYLIRTAEELDIMRNYGGCFSIMNDIDLTDYLADTENGWEPIVGRYNNTFSGHIYGNGHKITGLWVNRPKEYAGIFRWLEGSIHQLGVETSERGILGDSYVGILAAFCHGTISECYSMGYVRTDDNSSRIGGLVGGSSNGLIINSYSIATIKIGNSDVINSDIWGGGLGTTGTIFEYSYFSGHFQPIPTKENKHIGGIDNYRLNNPATCYFDTQTTGIPGGQTTAEMQSQSTYEGWDFETIWRIEEGQSYPTLRCFDK